MSTRILVTLVSMLVLSGPAIAQTWTTPDGFLSVTPPDASTFQAIPTPPAPFVGLWISNDDTLRFGVAKLQIPPTIKLIQSSAEEGLAEEVGGKVTRLPNRRVCGHEVWSMTAKGQAGTVTQAMVRHDGALYKIIAITVGDATDAEAVNRFIGSFSITEPSNTQPSGHSATQPVRDLGGDGGIDLHNLSKTIGSVGVLVFIGLLVYLVMRTKKSQES